KRPCAKMKNVSNLLLKEAMTDTAIGIPKAALSMSVITIYRCSVMMLRKSKEWRWILYRGMVVERDAQGNALRVTGTCSNIDERKRYEEDLRYLSTHDALTGLYNRAYFDAEMARIAL